MSFLSSQISYHGVILSLGSQISYHGVILISGLLDASDIYYIPSLEAWVEVELNSQVEAWVRAPLFVAKALSPVIKDGCSPWIRAMWLVLAYETSDCDQSRNLQSTEELGLLCLLLLEPCNTQYVNKPKPTYSMIRHRVMRDTQSVPLNHVTATCQTG